MANFCDSHRCSGVIEVFIKSLCEKCIYWPTHAFLALSFEISISVGSMSCPMIVCSLFVITCACATLTASLKCTLGYRSNP
jgi:hypothetical protein